MTTKTSSGTSVLVIILLIVTFPFWIGIIAGFFGLVAGLFGAVIGIIAGVFGAVFGAIGSVFGIFDWFSYPHIHIGGFKFFLVVALIFAIVMMSRSKKKS